MPELPEVETIKRGLEKTVIGKKITGIEIMQKRSIRNSKAEFIKKLKGRIIEKMERKGKFIAIKLKNKGLYLIIHLGMTGQLVYAKDKKSINKHLRVSISLTDSSKIYFNDIRRFGYLKLAGSKEKEKIFANLGIDPLNKDFTLRNFGSIFKNRKMILKPILLNQKLIAGIGNIYADEICFDAELKPNRKADSLKNEEIKRLYESIKKVLNLAIKHRGTTFRDYVDAGGNKGEFIKFLKVYKKENQECKKCKNRIIEKIKLAGRSTRYCRKCQR